MKKKINFRSVVDKNPGIIQGIVLAPTLGTMYWHDDDGEKETLKTARMDGTRVDQVSYFYLINLLISCQIVICAIINKVNAFDEVDYQAK